MVRKGYENFASPSVGYLPVARTTTEDSLRCFAGVLWGTLLPVMLYCEQSLFSQSSLSSAGLERAKWPFFLFYFFARFARFPCSRDHPEGLLAVYCYLSRWGLWLLQVNKRKTPGWKVFALRAPCWKWNKFSLSGNWVYKLSGSYPGSTRFIGKTE